MVESVDTRGLKLRGGNPVRVRVPAPASFNFAPVRLRGAVRPVMLRWASEREFNSRSSLLSPHARSLHRLPEPDSGTRRICGASEDHVQRASMAMIEDDDPRIDDARVRASAARPRKSRGLGGTTSMNESDDALIASPRIRHMAGLSVMTNESEVSEVLSVAYDAVALAEEWERVRLNGACRSP